MTEPALLPAVVHETGADAAVIFLHGLGDDGNGWSGVVPELRLPSNFRVRFVFPHAPVMPVTINNGFRMRAWYDIHQADLGSRADLDGVRASQRHLEALVAAERARGIDASRIVIGGFSQGGAVALYTGLRHAERLAGIVALSTYLIGGEALAYEASSVNRDLPILMAHGLHDPVVQFAWAEQSRKALEQGGWHPEWHTYPMEHSAVLEEIRTVGAFIARVLTVR